MLIIGTCIELTLLLWGKYAIVASHGGYFEEVPLAVPAQFLVVAPLLFATGSEFRGFERLAAVPLWWPRTITTLVSLAIVGSIAAFVSFEIGNPGTIGTPAPVRTFIGMYGVGLVASVFVDRRVASLAALAPVVGPLTINPLLVPGNEVWNFAITTPGDHVSWIVAMGWFAVGLVLHVRFEHINFHPISRRVRSPLRQLSRSKSEVVQRQNADD